MCKIIDPFVRYEPSTPRDLKRHLHSIEEKIVESLAWERGSSLYPLLVMAAEHQDPKPPPPVHGQSVPAHTATACTCSLSVKTHTLSPLLIVLLQKSVPTMSALTRQICLIAITVVLSECYVSISRRAHPAVQSIHLFINGFRMICNDVW